MSPSPKLLILDDDPGVVSWLVESLQEEGFHVQGETSASLALESLARSPVDLVVSDVEMPEMRGIDLVRALQAKRARQMVLLITAFGSIDLAVESVRAGAVDFLAKPFRIEALVLAIRRALRERQLRREIVRLREAVVREAPSGIAVRSQTMQRVLDLAARAARSTLPVLITGESGTGKGVLARFIHERSDRASNRFVQLNCAALPAGVAESELFGVRRGAYTDAKENRAGVFEQAHRGTLFLDEVGELPLEVQPKLLQALESNRVRPLGAASEVEADVRIVAATNRSLEEAVRAQRFRPDLFHRLNVVRVQVPSLRDRPEDVDPIVDHVLGGIARRSGQAPAGVSLDAMQWLRAQPWPGNVRELVNVLERAAALTDHDVLTLDDVRPAPMEASVDALLGESAAVDLPLAAVEREYIRRILAKTGGHKARAARILGLDRRTLYRKAAEIEGRSDVEPEPRDDDEP